MKASAVLILIVCLMGCQNTHLFVSQPKLSDDARYFCEKELLGDIIQQQIGGQKVALCQFVDNTGKVQSHDAHALLKGFADMMIKGDTLPRRATKTVGAANPASTYCVEQGGQSHIKTDKDGNQYGECHLPDGRVVDEWEYFRKNSPSP
ncbi:DUF333 domain-containing protein [Moraxella sp. VT-16-12]|uniref:putative hemolysin n=1 Tax=Moraxella sp. VT-16-12 TaxID=2014877 RepID=UPI002108253D|nr:DUF333 domain-containing protein [Moraxella sp. VT-16-12]